MKKSDKLIQAWLSNTPRSVTEKEAVLVMESAGLKLRRCANGHLIAFHKQLVGSIEFPTGTLTVGCHLTGKQGFVHPKAIYKIVKAIRLILEINDND